MVEQIQTCLKDYNIEIDYKNVDFKADVVVLYTRIREDTARYFEVDEQLFGPVPLTEPKTALLDMSS